MNRRATAMAAPVRAALVGIQIVKTAQAFGFMVVSAVQFYIFLAYMPTFVQRYAGLGPAAALWSNTAGLFLIMITIPLFGALSDRVGRKPAYAPVLPFLHRGKLSHIRVPARPCLACCG